MESVKVDRTKLKTVKSYASLRGWTVQHVYNLVKQEKVKIVEIDNVKFIQV